MEHRPGDDEAGDYEEHLYTIFPEAENMTDSFVGKIPGGCTHVMEQADRERSHGPQTVEYLYFRLHNVANRLRTLFMPGIRMKERL